MDLPKDYFRDKSPAEIVAKVATITLANISLLGADELKRIGWLDNPIIDILYSLTLSGVWIANTDAYGGEIVSDVNTTNHLLHLTKMLPATYATPTYISSISDAPLRAHRIMIVGISTDGAGAAAAAPIITGPAGYYPVCRIKTIHSTVAEATTQLLFTATGGSVVGPARMDFNLAAYITQEIGGAHGQLFYNLTDASSINIAVNSGPISATIQIEMEYWYET